jgi:hypothetical protein
MTASDNKEIKVTASDALEFEPVAPVAPKSRFGLKLVVVLVVVGGGVGAWERYGDALMQVFSGGESEAPLIKAAPGPVKVRPENPGGLKIPNRDKLVYDRINKSSEGGVGRGPESLLPPPEQPLPKPAAPKTPEKPLAEKLQPAAPKPTPKTNPVAKVPTVEDVKAAKRPAPPPPPPAPPTSTTPTSTTASSPSPKTTVAKPASGKAATGTAVKKTELSATPRKTVPVPRSSSYLVQLAAARSSKGARTEWDRLKTKNQDLLGNLGLIVTKADLGPGKGIFYRLRAGPIANEAAARTLCRQLTKRRIGCLIIKPQR